MRDEIKEILYDKKTTIIDKAVKIDKLICGADWKPDKLAEALNINADLLTQEVELLKDPVKRKQDFNKKRQDYIDAFYYAYMKVRNEKYRYIPADIKQIEYTMKVATLEEYKAILNYIIMRNNNKAQQKLEWQIENVLENFKPVRVYSNINYLIGELKKRKTAGFGYGFGRKT